MELLIAHVPVPNGHIENVSYTDALASGIAAAVAGAALKHTAKAAVMGQSDRYRAQLATTSPGKLAAYRVKEEIARDPDSADPAELALIDREAAARDTDRAGLLALISAQAAAYRQTALLIEALEAEAKAAIEAIADDAADIEAQIGAALHAAKTQAETAFAEAQTLLAAG